MTDSIKKIVPLSVFERFPWVTENKVLIFDLSVYVNALREGCKNNTVFHSWGMPETFSIDAFESLQQYFIFFGNLPTKGVISPHIIFQISNQTLLIGMPYYDDKQKNVVCYFMIASSDLEESYNLVLDIDKFKTDNNEKPLGFASLLN